MTMRRLSLRLHHLLSAALLLIVLAAPALGAEDCGWSPGFGILGVDKPVYAWAVYDDGSGPAIYAGGWFTNADGKPVNNIARWDGKSWKPLKGPSGTGTDSVVSALAVYDDGNGEALYVGGSFTHAGGVPARYVARWNGHRWKALTGTGGSLSGPVNALAVYDDGHGPALYAGGFFEKAGKTMVNHVARWDGRRWSALAGPSGAGVGMRPSADRVLALGVYDDGNGEALFLGGFFGMAGGIEAHNVARWDGTRFSALSGPAGNGTDNGVNALAVYDDGNGEALFVGGHFLQAGGKNAPFIARWDGAAFSRGSNIGTGGTVRALAVHDDGSGEALYIGGSFLSRWDGQRTTYLAGPGGAGGGSRFLVWSLGVFDDGHGSELYLGGSFSQVAGELANHAARWDGTSFSAVGGSGTLGAGPGGLNDTANALAVYDDGTGPGLYVGGYFSAAGSLMVNGIARWDGASFAALGGPAGTGVDGYVEALAVYGDDLYVGGQFQQAGGVEASNIARWDGTSFSALMAPGGNGTNLLVKGLTVYDGDLYIIGSFDQAGGEPIKQIARWDGTTFSALPGATDLSALRAMAVFDDGAGPVLYVAGDFRDGNGGFLHGLARWDGTTFTKPSAAAGNTTDNLIQALQVFDDGHGDDLYVGGLFTEAGGRTSLSLARWNGTAFLSSGFEWPIETLAVHDNGAGPALYIGGNFPQGVVQWDSLSVSPLAGPAGDGIDDGGVQALASFDDGTGPTLYAAGSFATAGGIQSSRFGRWTCTGLLTTEPLRLYHGRFEATAVWTDTHGVRGTGHPVPLTDKSGYFYFFGQDNVELVVKVLDGCGSNGHFWVFAAGLTNLGVELTVHDTGTGVKKVYTTPAGSAFPPIQDTQALPCSVFP